MLMDGEDENLKLQEVVEPLTGSSVIVEKKEKKRARFELPQKPKFQERLRQVIGQSNKKHLKRLLVFGGVGILLTVGSLFFVKSTKMFEIDYSEAYFKAKDLRPEIQTIQKDFECDRVKDYVDSQYTTEKTFMKYVLDCKAVGRSANKFVKKLGETEGIKRDNELDELYQDFKQDFDIVLTNGEKLGKSLEPYVVWHNWVLTETKENNKNQWDWSDATIETAAKILTDSKNEKFKKYGMEWKKRKKEVAKIYRNYYYPAKDTEVDMFEEREKMMEAQNKFVDWKRENQPKVQEMVPIKKVSTKRVIAGFRELYSMVRQKYQKHYNRKIGGCKEVTGQVICE